MLDKAQPIRKGDELNRNALIQYCAKHLPEINASVKIYQFPHGFSNLTYLLKSQTNEWVLRRPPHGANIKSGHDMAREFKVLAGLKKVYPLVPNPLVLCSQNDVLGTPFYIMERVSGIVIRDKLPKPLQEPTLARELSINVIDNLAKIHQLNIDKAELLDLGKPNGYVQRQISGWYRRYSRAKTDSIKEMEDISAWLEANQPTEVSTAIIHNDYKYDNLILDSKTLNIKAVLDWEMATIGCPLMDLGCALAYWIQADDPVRLKSLPLVATQNEGTLSRLEAAQRYHSVTGLPLDDLIFYNVYGVWRLAIIIQQIYARYKLGFTKDPRFSTLIDDVYILAKRAQRMISTGVI